VESGYGYFLEIFQKPGVFLKIHELRLDFEPVYGPFAKWRGFSGFRFIFQKEKRLD
jgi:hypothetical protein